MSHIGVPQPRLPFGPLQRVVESRAARSAWNPTGTGLQGGGMLSSLGWDNRSWQQRAYHKGRADGSLTVKTADRLACDLGRHPAEIWGDDWWTATAEQPDPFAGNPSPVAAAHRLRQRGVAFADMPDWVREGQREAWRANRKNQHEKRATA